MNSESLTSPQAKRLPDSWVHRIFSAMQGHYGSRFLNMWGTGQQLPDGQDAGIVNAMNHWAEKLGGFTDNPECIKHALAILPPEPPSLPQFVELCRHAPRNQPLALEHHLTPEERERNMQRLREIKEMLNSKFVAA